MQIMIMPNLSKKNALENTIKVIKYLLSYKISIILSDAYKNNIFIKGIEFKKFAEGMELCDILICIGGDGTIINASKQSLIYNKPLLGINIGRLGYLAGLEMSEFANLEKLISNDYEIEERMMLEAEILSDKSIKYQALNDIVVSNGRISRIIDLEIFCNNKSVLEYRADGVILSTPTGSTAYALSAGGPIIEPTIELISLTPICPHSLLNRTVLFSSSKIVTIAPSKKNCNPIYVTIDGQQGFKLKEDDKINIYKSNQKVKLIKLSQKPFFELLNNKFNLV